MSATVMAMVRSGTEGWTGRLVAERDRRRPRVSFPKGGAPEQLALGTTVELALPAATGSRVVRGPCVLVEVSFQRQGVEVALQPADPAVFADALPEPEPSSEDRRSRSRSIPPEVEERMIRVRIPGRGPGATRHLAGRLTDASAGGLGVTFAVAAEPVLRSARVLICEVAMGRDQPLRDWSCDVRNRQLAGSTVRYGLEFRTESGDPAPPRFEPLWDCAGCGERALLGETHRFCAGCGAPRGSAPMRLPDWDDLSTAATHRFGGVDRSCGSCATAHSAKARCCTFCGAALPDR